MTDREQLGAYVRRLRAELDAAERQLEDAYRPLLIERLRAGDVDGAAAFLREMPDCYAKVCMMDLMRVGTGKYGEVERARALGIDAQETA
jgi:hypothetical protein